MTGRRKEEAGRKRFASEERGSGGQVSKLCASAHFKCCRYSNARLRAMHVLGDWLVVYMKLIMPNIASVLSVISFGMLISRNYWRNWYWNRLETQSDYGCGLFYSSESKCRRYKI